MGCGAGSCRLRSSKPDSRFGTVVFTRSRKGRKNSAQFLLFVGGLLLRARGTGKHIVLALDNGPIHTSKKSSAFLNHPEVRRHIRDLWLPKYTPNLNDQERVWKLAKQQGVANVLFSGRDSLMNPVRQVLNSINATPRGSFEITRRTDPRIVRKYLESISVGRQFCR